LGDQLPQAAGTQNENAVYGTNPDLFLDLKGGGQGFCKYGRIIGNRIRDCHQVFKGQAKVFGEGTVAVFDTQDRAIFTVGGPGCQTGAARFDNSTI
jgi:hypothetical protein